MSENDYVTRIPKISENHGNQAIFSNLSRSPLLMPFPEEKWAAFSLWQVKTRISALAAHLPSIKYDRKSRVADLENSIPTDVMLRSRLGSLSGTPRGLS